MAIQSVVMLYGKILIVILSFARLFVFEENRPLFSAEKSNALDAFIDSLMSCRNNTGLTIALVHRDETILTKGYGYRRLGDDKQPMTSHTKITVGSLTKSFTSTLLANAIANNLTSWDTPLVDVLGDEFELQDEFRTQKACLKDILAHRLGMPSYWGASTAGLNFTRRELCMK